MHSSKLITLLRGLRDDEIHWFQKFLKSPFFNNNKLAIRLFEYVKKYHPEFDSPKLDKEKTFKKLFPNEKFNAQKLRKVMYELTALVEEFFITMYLRNKDFRRKRILIEEFGERNLYTQFEKGTKELIRELDALPYRDTFFYQNIFELNYNYSNHQETNRQKLNGQLLKKSTEHLDYFYLLQKQQLELGIKSFEKLFNEKVNLNSLEEAQNELEKESIFKIYKLINKAISKPDYDKNYLEIESVFRNEIGNLGNTESLIILRILLNYSSSQINKGIAKHFKKMFSLYKFGLERKLFIENAKIGETIFTNIVTVGCNVKEFEWVEYFIKTHKKYLPDSVREDGICFGLGQMYYHKKEFSNAIDILLKHNFLKPLQILQSKTILLRAYFEQFLDDDSYYDLLIAQTQSFEKYIRRNELISNSKKERYLNFVLFTRKIARRYWQNSMNEELNEKLKNSESVILKFWLLEKLKELQK